MLVVFAVLVLVSIPLLAVGLRGRRADDHPLCRRCGYDLTGHPAGSTRCSECGADLTRRRAVRVGHRRRRPVLTAAGVVLFVTAGVGTGDAGWTLVRAFDPTPYEPLWWLRHRLTRSAAEADAVFADVARRTPWLTAAQLAPFVNRALAIQAIPAVADVPAYQLVEAVHSDGKLSANQWLAYAKQAYVFDLKARPIIAPGDPLPISLSITSVKADKQNFVVTLDVASVSIDRRPVLMGSERRMVDSSFLDDLHWQQRQFVPNLGGAVTIDLTAGKHAIVAAARLRVFDVGHDPRAPSRVPGASPYPPLGSADLSLETAVSVVSGTRVTFDDESLRPGVQAALSVGPVRMFPPHQEAYFYVGWSNVPTRVNYSVFLRGQAGAAIAAGTCDVSRGGSTATADREVQNAAAAIGAASYVDVVFRPDMDSIRQELDVTPTWGGTIVVHDVPVARDSVFPASRPIRVDGTE